ncbi:MAG: hypothetical protein J5973_08645 [Eubacterium sp.]|nr:hypothetical protein [Eubacterium sp.]
MIMDIDDYNTTFLQETAESLIRDISEEDKEAILQNPDYAQHHFWLGLYIRNRYLYTRPETERLPFRADKISRDIFERSVEILQQGQ